MLILTKFLKPKNKYCWSKTKKWKLTKSVKDQYFSRHKFKWITTILFELYIYSKCRFLTMKLKDDKSYTQKFTCIYCTVKFRRSRLKCTNLVIIWMLSSLNHCQFLRVCNPLAWCKLLSKKCWKSARNMIYITFLKSPWHGKFKYAKIFPKCFKTKFVIKENW